MSAAYEPVMFSTAARFGQVRYEFDPSTATLWSYMRPHPRPSLFTPTMLAEMETVEAAIERAGGVIEHEGTQHQLAHMVYASDSPGVWSLGGDLATFAAAIRAQDFEQLQGYGNVCVNGMYRRHRGLGADITHRSASSKATPLGAASRNWRPILSLLNAKLASASPRCSSTSSRGWAH